MRGGLDVLAKYGFALAGGYALQAHQLVDRMSEDVDMFTDSWDPDRFGQAVVAMSDPLRRDGPRVEIVHRAANPRWEAPRGIPRRCRQSQCPKVLHTHISSAPRPLLDRTDEPSSSVTYTKLKSEMPSDSC